MNYLVLDTETSGFISPGVRVVQVGYCRVSDGKVLSNSQINLFPSPDMNMSKQAEEAHGLSVEKLKETGSDPGEVFRSLYTNLQKAAESNTWIIGHNIVGFDHKALNIEFKRHVFTEFDFNNYKILDTGMIYKASHMRWQRCDNETIWDFMNKVNNERVRIKWNLKLCCEDFGIKFDDNDAHGAAYDCLKTHEVFREMERNGTLENVIGDLDE